MLLSPLDWAVVAAYVVFALAVGLRFARRAGKDVDEFFLSGRTLPWWIAGTSMVATSFAADTPLVISAWVRDHGIWKNWLWWCYAIGGLLTVFLFARYWRRGEVMTTAELAELRYGGPGARVLRGFLGTYHAAITNTIVLCWVLLAAAKIMDVLFGVDKLTALVAASAISLVYASLAGFWGVVVTDLLQFIMAAVGAIWLAVRSWDAIGGVEGMRAGVESGAIPLSSLDFFPASPGTGPLSPDFWTANVTAVAVYLGVAWWTVESVDGGSYVVQRISASRDEVQGRLAVLWYTIVHYAFRPWPWILVAIASMLVLPTREVAAPVGGTVSAVTEEAVTLETSSGPLRVELGANATPEADWTPIARVRPGDEVEPGGTLARTDSERAYVVMMARFLPTGILGLMVASLLAAFMSTIDTHVNLASSYFVNDVYRRFVATDRPAAHYVLAARLSSVVVLALAGALAWQADSISQLFTFFLAFLGGVGPVYILRWLWWRVRASTEIVAMVASSVTTVAATFWLDSGWPESPLSPGGTLSSEGRLCLVSAISTATALASMQLTRTPDPRTLVDFYRRVRPVGWWRPVRALAGDGRGVGGGWIPLGVLGGIGAVYGSLFALGHWLLGRPSAAATAALPALVGSILMVVVLRRPERRPDPGPDEAES